MIKAICKVKEFSGEEEHKTLLEQIGKNEIENKDKILTYLKSFTANCAAGMSLMDEVLGKTTTVGVSGYEDGQYYWDTREIYHFEKYNLELEPEFIDYVLNRYYGNLDDKRFKEIQDV